MISHPTLRCSSTGALLLFKLVEIDQFKPVGCERGAASVLRVPGRLFYLVSRQFDLLCV